MIKSRSDLEMYLKMDFARFAKRPNLKDFLLANEVWYIFHYQRHLRLVEYYSNTKRSKLLYLYHFFRYKRLGFKLRFTIYPNTTGPGLRIFHTGDFIHVKKKCRIGVNCTLLPGVVIGNKTVDDDDSEVLVGDNAYFGLGSKVFGSVTIGDNVVIGANSVITKDIPSNCIVGGVPAKIIRHL